MSRREPREREFTEFFGSHALGLRRTAYLVVRDWHLAEDLTQQAMAKLYAAWGRTRPDTRLAYARRIVVNECLSHLRRHRPESAVEAVPDLPSPSAGDHPLDLGAVLALLPARQRAIVALRFLDDLSVEEVGRLLGVADGTVKSQTSRALDTLRRHLPDLAEELR
ncbi:SigE family RNA polymerase sigma factor [Nocardioides sp. W7]|uniref:SigE family RNA polymerase sigma factor n=1 Tax=Nocardioides sp. W7 TaxID=2931390 RepID=UPI001FD0A995|nr:SigE family RNA polymerase sigma factor [Nocardioides sp. W7]